MIGENEGNRIFFSDKTSREVLNMKKNISIFLLMVFSHTLFSANYNYFLDDNASPYMGAEDMLFIQKSMMDTEDAIIKKSTTPHFYHILGRLAENVFFWSPMSDIMVTIQHEVFGHGYRIRDLKSTGIRVTDYGVGFPPPYGYGGGYTAYRNTESITPQEAISIAAAGTEATAIMANRVKLKMIKDQKMDFRQAGLYSRAQHDLTLYAFSLISDSDEDASFEGHDIADYIFYINTAYPWAHLDKSRMAQYATVNLLDPFTYYSFVCFWLYVFRGINVDVPMIPIKGVKYLPGFRMGLTPFGPEVFFENYLLAKSNTIYFYLKGGNHASNEYYGMGIEWDEVFQWKKWAFGFTFDAWFQPEMLSTGPTLEYLLDAEEDIELVKEDYQKIFGVSGSMIGRYQVIGERVSLFLQLGGKSKGFLPGESLRAAPIVRMGLSFKG